MKRMIAIILCVLTLVAALAGCGGAQNNHADIKVVTTVFPIYDWVREIVKDDVDIKLDMLLDNGADLHSYQPSATDIMDISDCDVFIYVGGESDKWVSDVIAQAKNKDMVVLDLLDILGDKAKEEEVKEGMQEDEHEHEDEKEEHKESKEEREEEHEYDEHVWLSLKNASLFVTEIADALGKKDAQHADAFKTNAAGYTDKLTELDKQYQSAADSAKTRTLLFGDRFPFRYLTDDCKLDYYAAFSGCSAETEASFETIVFLADKVDELGLKTIMQIESSDGSIAKTIRDNTKSKNQEILTLDSMQSVTQKQVNDGETYLNIMQSNLEVLKKALE